MNKLLGILFVSTSGNPCLADAYVIAPTPGPIGGPTDTATFFPFLYKQMNVHPFYYMRYQQVYIASVLTNVDRSLFYITTLTFFLDDFGRGAFPWRVTSMQINLSTTQKTADGLSSVFAEN